MGVRLMVLEPEERIVAVAKLAEKEEDVEDDGSQETEEETPAGGTETQET
jgi:DNA gyrase subunit A